MLVRTISVQSVTVRSSQAPADETNTCLLTSRPITTWCFLDRWSLHGLAPNQAAEQRLLQGTYWIGIITVTDGRFPRNYLRVSGLKLWSRIRCFLFLFIFTAASACLTCNPIGSRHKQACGTWPLFEMCFIRKELLTKLKNPQTFSGVTSSAFFNHPNNQVNAHGATRKANMESEKKKKKKCILLMSKYKEPSVTMFLLLQFNYGSDF